MNKPLKNYKVTTKAIEKHKIMWHFLWLVTYIILFPFVIIQILNEVFEVLLNFVISLREKIVYTIFKLLFKKDCIYDEE